MLTTILSLFAKPLVDTVLKMFTKFQDRKMTEAEVRAEVEKEIAKTLATVATHQADVIKTEITSGSWLGRNWRPIVGLSMTFIFIFYSIITPVAVAWFDMAPVRVGDKLLEWVFQTLQLGMGGYIGLEALSKVIGRQR